MYLLLYGTDDNYI